jgi:hypothetical protein
LEEPYDKNINIEPAERGLSLSGESPVYTPKGPRFLPPQYSHGAPLPLVYFLALLPHGSVSAQINLGSYTVLYSIVGGLLTSKGILFCFLSSVDG